MATFLKIVSGVYLVFVWILFAMGASVSKEMGIVGSAAFVVAIGLSIPAVALFAFGQVVGDIRAMRKISEAQGVCLQALQSYKDERR